MREIFLEQQPLVGKLKDFKPLTFVKVETAENELLWNYMVKTWHYLGYQAIIGPRIKYLVLYQDKPLAAISFNQAAFRIGVRDTWIGINHVDKLKILKHILNNNRFLILPWVRIKNLASHVLSKALKLLENDWPKAYNIVPYAVETCVDFTQYKGICYKAANWIYLGETSGFGKIGKTFVYHGNRKGVFIYLLNRKLLQLISEFPARKPNPNLEHVRGVNMMLSIPDWSPDLFDEIGLNQESVANLGALLTEYLSTYSGCYSRIDQQANGETYIKGLLSDLPRKSIEPIALRYLDEKGVRTLQLFQKVSPWDHRLMKKLYQRRVFMKGNDPRGMLTADGSDYAKKGKKSAGVQRQYCGNKGKTDNCQAGVYIGYSGSQGYGLLDAQLYLPEAWFDAEHRLLWDQCDIPEETEFKTKSQMALEMIQEAVENNDFNYKWVGCDAAFGCDSKFRAALPKSICFFADLHSNQRVFPSRPQWSIPEYKGKGKIPTKEVPSVSPISVSTFAMDDTIPWETITLMEGAKGPVTSQVKYCRVIELQDGKDGDELWLYMRKFEDGSIKYSFSNAPMDIDIEDLHHAATLRWPIEQSFQECKSFLGMSDYETRSYIGWQRHMLLVMVAHLFIVEVRFSFKKKSNEPVLTMPQALILIIAAISKDPEKIRISLRDVAYYQKNNAKAYHSHRKRKLLNTA